MVKIKHIHLRTGLTLAAALTLLGAAGAAAAQAPPVRVPLDTETTLSGVDVACTGIGQTKDQPRWQAYPVRVEFADSLRNYLAGEVLTLSEAKGAALFTVRCEGPWLLLKLPPDRFYQVTAHLTERDTAPQSGVVKAPAHGQARFVLTFPDGR